MDGPKVVYMILIMKSNLIQYVDNSVEIVYNCLDFTNRINFVDMLKKRDIGTMF